ncbi:MAG: acyltransferase [Deltaproteobacteria bacterium]|jgi:peptidoglycan/LPS O-acetylase OafA/YrhL
MTVTPIGGEAHRAFRETKFFASLDGLRCISILAVIWHHAAGTVYGAYNPLFARGNNGVTLFFAISGFLITTLLIREKEKTGKISLRKFYMRRTLRIFPLYYTVLLVYVAAVWFVEKDPNAKSAFFDHLPFYATYTSNWFVEYDHGRVIFYFAWSLATEEQFYMVWPAVSKRLGWGGAVVFMLTLVTATLFVQIGVIGVPDGLFRTILLSVAPGICLGSVLAHLLHRPASFDVLYKIFGWRYAPVFFFVLTAVFLATPLYDDWGIHVMCVLIVTACVIREDHVLRPLLSWRPVRWMGTVSYGMYLMHMLSLNAFKMASTRVGFHHPLVEFVGASLIATVAATISFKYYESFFLNIKKRFETPR